MTLFGITEQVVPAGDHVVKFAYDCLTGNVQNTASGSISVGVIVLGG